MSRLLADGSLTRYGMSGSAGMFGSQARPGMAGAMGLFGSQARPGMKGSNLGSLSGSSLGTVLEELGADAVPTVMTAPAPATVAPAGMTNQTKLMLAGAAVGVWWFFIRKK